MIKLFGEAAGVTDPEKLIGGINRDFNRVFSEARKYYKEDEDVTVEGAVGNVVTGEVEVVETEEVTPAEDLPSMEDSEDEFTGMAPDAIDPVSSDPSAPAVDEEHVKEDGSEGEVVETEGDHPAVSEDTVHEVAEQFINHINDTITAAAGGDTGIDVDTPMATDGGEATTDDSTDVDAPVSDIQTEDGDVQKVDAITVEVNV